MEKPGVWVVSYVSLQFVYNTFLHRGMVLRPTFHDITFLLLKLWLLISVIRKEIEYTFSRKKANILTIRDKSH